MQPQKSHSWCSLIAMALCVAPVFSHVQLQGATFQNKPDEVDNAARNVSSVAAPPHRASIVVVQVTHVVTPSLTARFERMREDVVAVDYAYMLIQWDVCHKLQLPHVCIGSDDILLKFPRILHKMSQRWQWNACDAPYLYWFKTADLSFENYWIVEYDVVWSGRPSEFFRLIDERYPHADYVAPYIATRDANDSWKHIKEHVGTAPYPWKTTLVQMIRISHWSMSKTVHELRRSWRYCEAQIPSYSRTHVSYMLEYSRFFGPFQWDTTVTDVPKTNVTRFYHRKKTR